MFSLLVMIASSMGAILTCCYFVDKIATAEFRQQLASLLAGHSRTVGSLRPAEHIQYFIANTIGSYFTGEYFSFRNIVRSALLTGLALALLIPLVCIVNGKSPSELFKIWGPIDSARNIFLLLYLFAACLVIDIIGFLQTAMFMRLASTVPRARDMIAMAAFDVIVTLNLFTMVFAAFLVPLTYAVDDRGMQLRVKVVTLREDAPPPKDQEKLKEPIFSALKDGAMLAELYVAAEMVDNNSARWLSDSHAVLKNYSASEAIFAFFQAYGIRRNEITQDLGKEGAEGSLEKVPGIAATMKAADSLVRINPVMRYTFIYTQSHAVQDQFYGLLKLMLITIRTGNLFAYPEEYTSVPLVPSEPLFTLCDGVVNFTVEAISTEKCEKFAVLSIGEAIKRNYRFFLVHHSEVAPIPVTVLAASSLFLTAAFYIALASYLTIALSSRLAGGLFLSEKIFDLRAAPLTVGAAYAMVCISPVLAAIVFASSIS